jgi:hypothetical protein
VCCFGTCQWHAAPEPVAVVSQAGTGVSEGAPRGVHVQRPLAPKQGAGHVPCRVILTYKSAFKKNFLSMAPRTPGSKPVQASRVEKGHTQAYFE